MDDDIVLNGRTYRRNKAGDWIEVVNEGGWTYVFDHDDCLDEIERLRNELADYKRTVRAWEEARRG